MGDAPDQKIAEFLLCELEKAEENSLIVLPEYSNAGGISDPESEKKAMPRVKAMLEKAASVAKEKSAYVAINVLENRDGHIKNSTYLFNKKGEIGFVYDKVQLNYLERVGIKQGNFVQILARLNSHKTEVGSKNIIQNSVIVRDISIIKTSL